MKIIGDGGHAAVIRSLPDPGWGTIIAVGNNAARKREAELLKLEKRIPNSGPRSPILIHPNASINGPVDIGEGTVVMDGVVVQPHVKIGRHVILNSSCSVDHHCIIGDYAHIGPGAHLAGNVTVGEGAFMGVGSCAVPGAIIPAWSLVKAGERAK